MTQLPRNPDLNAQRAAMQRLAFLVGNWDGEARLLHGLDQDLHQTEEVQYKLAGLILFIEGVGRGKSDGQPVIQALAIISFDDETGTYRMRAFNNGRFLESELKLLEQDRAIGWGFALGEIKTKSVLRINDKGEWTELAEITIGSQLPKKLLELTVRPARSSSP